MKSYEAPSHAAAIPMAPSHTDEPRMQLATKKKPEHMYPGRIIYDERADGIHIPIDRQLTLSPGDTIVWRQGYEIVGGGGGGK